MALNFRAIALRGFISLASEEEEAAEAPDLGSASDMLGWRAAQGVLTSEGFFSVRLRYTPDYWHGESTGIHTLLHLCADTRCYYDFDSGRMVLEVNGDTIESDVLEFAAGVTLTVEVEHTDERRRLRVLGATTGNGKTVGDPTIAAVIESQVFVLGPPAGAEAISTLVELRPLDAETFTELAERRLLSQYDPDGNLRAIARVFARRWARIHDAALTIRDALDPAYAVGDQLDQIGAILVLPRHGFGDDRYRTFLQIKIELLLAELRDDVEWTGTAPNIIRIVRKFVGPDAPPVRYESYPPYSYTITVEDMDYSEAFLLQSFLTTASWAGVLGLLQIELGDGNNLMGSASVTVPRAGIMGSASVSVAGEMIMGTVLEIGE